MSVVQAILRLRLAKKVERRRTKIQCNPGRNPKNSTFQGVKSAFKTESDSDNRYFSSSEMRNEYFLQGDFLSLNGVGNLLNWFLFKETLK